MHRALVEVAALRPALALARRAVLAGVAIVVAILAAPAHGQVYKCTDSVGKTTYADAPCGNAGAPMRLPDEPTKGSSNPTACAQLKDELQRLDAEADRNAARGRKESAASASRRQSLGKQYSSRCVGISRSVPKAN